MFYGVKMVHINIDWHDNIILSHYFDSWSFGHYFCWSGRVSVRFWAGNRPSTMCPNPHKSISFCKSFQSTVQHRTVTVAPVSKMEATTDISVFMSPQDHRTHAMQFLQTCSWEIVWTGLRNVQAGFDKLMWLVNLQKQVSCSGCDVSVGEASLKQQSTGVSQTLLYNGTEYKK